MDLEYFRRVIVQRNMQSDIDPDSKTAYHGIFENFINFLGIFRTLPDRWEDKIVLYTSFLADNIYKEQTIRSYLSAIRHKLRQGGVVLEENRVKWQ